MPPNQARQEGTGCAVVPGWRVVSTHLGLLKKEPSTVPAMPDPAPDIDYCGKMTRGREQQQHELSNWVGGHAGNAS